MASPKIYQVANLQSSLTAAHDQANAAYAQANAAYAAANTGNSDASAAYAQANTAYAQANAAYAQANSARSDANTTFATINTTFSTVNTSVTNAHNQANLAYAAANNANLKSGGLITGTLNVTQDLIVSGNVYLEGNTTYINVATYSVDDPLIYLAANNNLTDSVDIGFMGGKNTSGTYSHTGLARDATDGKWKLFDGLPEEGHIGNVINFANTYLATLVANVEANSITLLGNTVATQANLTLAHNQANAAYSQANLAYDAANNRVLKTGDTMTGRLAISNTTDNVITSGIMLTGNRNYSAGDNGGIQIFATGSGGTIGTHDFGAIKFSARGFTGAGDGGGGIVSLHVGGSSSNATSNGMFIQADGTIAQGTQNVKFYTGVSATERMRIDANGNIGIGTSNPLRKLDISGGGLAFTESGGSSRNIHWGDTTNIYPVAIGGDGINGNLTFSTNTFGSPFAERMRIVANGFIGIGATSPAGLLHVRSTLAYPAYIFEAANTALYAGPYLNLRNTSVSENFGETSLQHVLMDTGDLTNTIFQIQQRTTSGSFVRQTMVYSYKDQYWGFFTNGSERMRLNSSGNLGIGTTVPTWRTNIVGSSPRCLQIRQSDTNNSDKYSFISAGHYTSGTYTDGFAIVGGVGSSGSNDTYIGGGISEALASTTIRFHTAANNTTVTGSERMRISSSGDVQIGNAVDAGNTLRFLDVYNTNTGSSAGAIARLITANVAGTGTTSVDIVKYKNGSFFINNNEPDSSAYTAFNIGSTERFRITPTGIVTASSRLSMGNALISSKTLDPTKWYRIATLSASNEGHEVDLRVRIPGSHVLFVIRLSKGTGNWVAQAYRAGHYIAPTTGYTAINKVRIYDLGVNAETHIEIQVAGATESKQYEVVVVNSVTPSTSRPTLVDFTDQGTGAAGVEFLVTEVNASWGTPSGQNVVFRDNGNVGIGTGTTLPAYKLDVNSTSGVGVKVATGGYNWLNLVSGYTGQLSIGLNDSGGSGALGINQYNSSGAFVRVAASLDSSGHATFNNRVGVNAAATDATFVFAVASGRTRLQANSEQYALGLRYNTTTGYYYIGASNSGSPALQFSNNGGAERARLSDAGGFSVGTTADPGTGAIFATGEITAFYSDDRLKNRIGNIDNALSKVLTLNGFYYEPNETAMDLGYEKKKQVGVSAQEVQEVLPEVVVAAPIDDKYMTVHYHKLVPLLIEAIKELNTKIEGMQKIIESKS